MNRKKEAKMTTVEIEKNVKKIKSIYSMPTIYLYLLNAHDIPMFCVMRYFSHFVGFSSISEVLNNGLTRIFYFCSFKILN